MFLPCHATWFHMDLRVVPFCTSEFSALCVVNAWSAIMLGDQCLQMLDVLREPEIVIVAEGNEFSLGLTHSMVPRNTHALIGLFDPEHAGFIVHQGLAIVTVS